MIKIQVELQPCKCAHPAIAVMDHLKPSPEDWYNPEQRVNRCCTKCWSHWYGPPDAIRFYTSKEWDATFNEPTNESEGKQ